jgi:hypothetical protein
MGRQLAIAMDLEDEDAFLAFLGTSADIALYRSWSPSPEPVASFVADAAASPFFVHNRAFAWKPEFVKVSYENQSTEMPGTYFRLLTRHAPVIEYSRHPIEARGPQVSGRLYWAKLFLSPPHEVGYNLVAFDLWFSSVAKWVRVHGKKLKHGASEPWCLPAARRKLRNAL